LDLPHRGGRAARGHRQAAGVALDAGAGKGDGMGLHRVSETQRLPIGLEEAWDFFSNPRNLAVITPPEMGFAIAHELPERMHPGLIIQYRVRPLFNIPVTWVTEI